MVSADHTVSVGQVEAGSFTEIVDGDRIADRDEIANHTAAVE